VESDPTSTPVHTYIHHSYSQVPLQRLYMTEPFRSRAHLLPVANRPIGTWPIRSPVVSLTGTFAPWNFCYLERNDPALSLPGTKVPENNRARELMGPGAKGPGSELAKEGKGQGANWPGSYWPIRSWERIGLGANWPGSEKAVNPHIHTHIPKVEKTTPSRKAKAE